MPEPTLLAWEPCCRGFHWFFSSLLVGYRDGNRGNSSGLHENAVPAANQLGLSEIRSPSVGFAPCDHARVRGLVDPHLKIGDIRGESHCLAGYASGSEARKHLRHQRM